MSNCPVLVEEVLNLTLIQNWFLVRLCWFFIKLDVPLNCNAVPLSPSGPAIGVQLVVGIDTLLILLITVLLVAAILTQAVAFFCNGYIRADCVISCGHLLSQEN